MTLRRSLVLSLALAAAGLVPVAGSAQTFPSKPLTLVVPYAPGGASDLIARIIAPRLGARLGKEVVVDNKSGAGGLIGIQAVANAAPDGHTLMIIDTSFAAMAALSPERRNGALKDVTPVGIVVTAPYVVVATPSFPAKNLQELIGLARSKPGQLNYGSGGNGSSTHLAGEWFKNVTGTDIVHVPFRGGSAVVQSMLTGQPELTFLTVPSVQTYVKSGRLKALAVSTEQRSPALPDVPTTKEAGLPKMVGVNWNAMFAPAKTPQAVIARLNRELAAVMNLPEVRVQVAEQAFEVSTDTPEHATALIEEEINRWVGVVKAGNIKPD